MTPAEQDVLEENEILGRRAASKAYEYIGEALGLVPGKPVSVQEGLRVAAGCAFAIANLDATVRLNFPGLDIESMRCYATEVSNGIVGSIANKQKAQKGKE